MVFNFCQCIQILIEREFFIYFCFPCTNTTSDIVNRIQTRVITTIDSIIYYSSGFNRKYSSSTYAIHRYTLTYFAYSCQVTVQSFKWYIYRPWNTANFILSSIPFAILWKCILSIMMTNELLVRYF